MNVVRELKPLHDRLLSEWNRYRMKEADTGALEECGKLLDQLKVKLTQAQFSFLPTLSPDEPAEVTYARDILEIGALWSIHKKNVDLFERYMAQLKCYYLDYVPTGIKESTYKNQLLGLNLLRLLSQNKLADFHTELELLPVEIRQSDQYIKHPVSIEQYLMEGSYNKVFAASGSIPAKEYSFFMSHLLHTIRDEIASCIEKAYEKISKAEALRMLNFKFTEEKEMLAYVEQRNWTLKKDMFQFEREKKADDIIPSFDLAQQAIDYARELEMIV